MTEKESLTHEIEDDLAARNRNWNKVDRNTNDIAENTTKATQNATNLDSHMLKTVEGDVHGLLGAVIVESGSNTKGSYVKFGDGTMIMHGVIPETNITAGVHEFNVNFPKNFISITEASFFAMGRPSGNWSNFGIIGCNVAANGTGRVTTNSAVAQKLIHGRWFAIGRWK